MTEQKLAKPVKPVTLDRWGLLPVRPRHVRGIVRNVRITEDVSPYGPMLVVDYDLWTDDGVPNIPVRMTGTDFMNRIIPENLLDVPDPDPGVRPITPTRVTSAHNDDHEIVAHYPGRSASIHPRGLAWTVMVVLIPFAVIALMMGLLGWHFGWFAKWFG